MLLSLVAAVVCKIDPVLEGMVRAGLGIQAICAYLGLSRATLDHNLIRLGLRTPHDRPLRKPGRNGWTDIETMRLIAWRMAGVHPISISERLNVDRSPDLRPRSPSAVRAKARRLGIPAPPRSELRLVPPARLVDPAPGFGLPSPNDGAVVDRASTPIQRCGTSAGRADTWSNHPAPEAPIVAPRSAVQPVPALRMPPVTKTPGRSTDQREKPLLRVIVPANAPLAPAALVAAEDKPAEHHDDVAPIPPAVKTPGPDPDLAWIKAARDRPRNLSVVQFMSRLYFGRQSYKQTALQVGMSEKAVATFYYRIGLPRDRNRIKFTDMFDATVADETLATCGYVLEICRSTKRYFWVHQSEKGKILFNRETRLAQGKIGDWERYKSQPITL